MPLDSMLHQKKKKKKKEEERKEELWEERMEGKYAEERLKEAVVVLARLNIETRPPTARP